MIAAGFFFLKTKGEEKSRYFWGLGLILWVKSAIVAGTSSQAFGYELKYRGQEFCLFSSNVELAYMLITASSTNFILMAKGYTSLNNKWRNNFFVYAVAENILYTVYLFVGAVIPNKIMISYEGFIAFIGINFIIMFALNLRQYLLAKERVDLNSIIIWISFLMVDVFYFLYLISDLSSILYNDFGVWFNENDLLHVFLILWVLLILFLFKKNLKDIDVF